MIKYAIACGQGHVFDVWFANADACDAQLAAGQVLCPICNDNNARKSLMTPSIGRTEKGVSEPAEIVAQQVTPQPAPVPSAAPPMPRRLMEKLWAIRSQIEQNAENVGREFATEARMIHEGEAEERAIWGECDAEEVEALLEDGVPIAPMPPARRDD
jgi:hypothetical protein